MSVCADPQPAPAQNIQVVIGPGEGVLTLTLDRGLLGARDVAGKSGRDIRGAIGSNELIGREPATAA